MHEEVDVDYKVEYIWASVEQAQQLLPLYGKNLTGNILEYKDNLVRIMLIFRSSAYIETCKEVDKILMP